MGSFCVILLYLVKVMNRVLVLSLLIGCFQSAHAYMLKNFGLEPQVQLEHAGPVLTLNGAAEAKRFSNNAYIAALYLHSPASDLDSIIQDSAPKRVLIKLTHPNPNADTLLKDWIGLMVKNTSPAVMQATFGDLKRIEALFHDAILKQGDEIQIDFRPGFGAHISIANRWHQDIHSEEFCIAFFNAFLGDKPPHDTFPEQLLSRVSYKDGTRS